MNDKEMKLKIESFLNENENLIKDLIFEFGISVYLGEVYDTNEFEEFVLECNKGTKEEEGYVNGWTDDKDDLFLKMINNFISNLGIVKLN